MLPLVKNKKTFLVILLLLLLASISKFFTEANEEKLDSLQEALEDFYINTIGYKDITIEDVDQDLNLVLLYTDEKATQKGKRFYAISNYDITEDGKFVLGNVRDEIGFETQGNKPIEMGHLVDGVGHVYQLILYNDEITMGSVELLLENGDVIEKSVSSNNAFIPLTPLVEEKSIFQNEDEDLEFLNVNLLIESVTIYDVNDDIIWSNKE